MEDMKITCSDCGRSFVFSVKDQKFYEEQHYLPPKRCRHCRIRRKNENERRKTYGEQK